YEKHNNDLENIGYRDYLLRLAGALLPKLEQDARGLDFGCGTVPVMADIFADRGYQQSSYDCFFYPQASLLKEPHDFITCSEAVEHFHHPANDFGLINTLLRPGGWLGIMTGILQDDRNFKGWWYTRDFTHVCFYSKATMEWLADYFGWGLIRLDGNIALFQKDGVKSAVPKTRAHYNIAAENRVATESPDRIT
ncbi:MAG: class I SAM-dependent methyltransferase, partial [Candidatus Marinimicrobia bacterium]|nr:class I SAM-dependent methyltransferase [Candidatus Neomarinimicrobiota bacterium]